MKILNKISQCRAIVEEIKSRGQIIGIVPTMGYLHEGHISLVKTARQQCQKVFMTIFVNPAQFGPGEDFERYPRDLERDAGLARENGVDYIFNPAVEEMYGDNHRTYVDVEKLTENMCGEHRPGHFRGVATIVLKIFNIIPAHKAYFGMKDFQQLAVIKKMVEDLDLDIEIIGCPTIREEDGLALSSRNKYLDPEQRKNAVVIYKELKKAGKAITSGSRTIKEIKEEAVRELKKNPYINKIDYFDIRDATSLEELDKRNGEADIIIAAAAWMGNTRLIDNVVISKKK